MNRALSYKFRFFTFVCIALLVYVHGYNLDKTYLAPYSSVDERLTFTTFFEYLFANGLLRFRIPMLFLISGYIYAMYDNRPYKQRIKKRFVSLMIPYLIWSAFGLAVTFLLQQFPFTANIVAAAGIDQLGDNRPYTEIGWKGILFRWLLTNVSYQLWFIFVLFFYNLIYPLIRWMILKLPFIWFPVTFFLWVTIFNVGFAEGQGLFFFSLGVWLQKKNISLEKQPGWLSVGHAWIFFIGICMVKTFMAYELEPNATATPVILLALYQLAIPVGILAIWFSSDKVVEWFMNQQWFHKASAFSFFIYGLHIPLLAYVMQMALMYLSMIPNYRLITYLIIPALMILFCISVGALVRKYMPKMYHVVTGGRGF
jgi:fucose 4-O-acetylase-like acetyltransferase